MVDYPADPSKGRFYVLLPAPTDRLLPAIRIVSGRIFPAYIRLTSKGDDGMVFSVGGEKQIALLFELQGIREALLLMGAVWKGVLDAHRPLDAGKVERLASDLTSRPEASLAHVRASGVIGNPGGIKNAEDCIRNVLAFCYWKYALGLRKLRKPAAGWPMPELELVRVLNESDGGKPVLDGVRFSKGGRAWGYSAKVINRRLEAMLPRANGWTWTDFTGDGLQSFYDRHGLFTPD